MCTALGFNGTGDGQGYKNPFSQRRETIEADGIIGPHTRSALGPPA